jgi:hypothetical protein
MESVYLGDAATLSFLQLLRIMVESVVGHCPFTNDPRRHKIMESQFSLPSNTRITHLLPDKQTATVLAESFFINVSIDVNHITIRDTDIADSWPRSSF